MDGTYTEKVNYTKPKHDQYGNPVVNFKSMKIRSGSIFRSGRKPTGAKRGRPQTKPAKAASTRQQEVPFQCEPLNQDEENHYQIMCQVLRGYQPRAEVEKLKCQI